MVSLKGNRRANWWVLWELCIFNLLSSLWSIGISQYDFLGVSYKVRKWFDGIYVRGHMAHINAGRHYHNSQPLCSENSGSTGRGRGKKNSKQYRSITQISAELGMRLCKILNRKWRHYIRKDSKSMAKLQVLHSEFYLSCWGGGAARQLQLLPPSSLPATTSQFTTAPLAL